MPHLEGVGTQYIQLVQFLLFSLFKCNIMRDSIHKNITSKQMYVKINIFSCINIMAKCVEIYFCSCMVAHVSSGTRVQLTGITSTSAPRQANPCQCLVRLLPDISSLFASKDLHQSAIFYFTTRKLNSFSKLYSGLRKIRQ